MLCAPVPEGAYDEAPIPLGVKDAPVPEGCVGLVPELLATSDADAAPVERMDAPMPETEYDG